LNAAITRARISLIITGDWNYCQTLKDGHCFRHLTEYVAWRPGSINDAYNQDDLYVELPFMEAMNDYGVTASWVAFGEYFRDTEFMLWHANDAGRTYEVIGYVADNNGNTTWKSLQINIGR
jgi:hypothetical protein